MNLDSLINADILVYVIPGAIFLFLVAMYKIGLEKKVQAKENIQELLGTRGHTMANQGMFRQREEFILKRRHKDEKSFMARLEADLERANLLLKPNELLLICFGMVFVVALIAFAVLGQPLLIAVPVGLGGFFLPILFLKVRIMLRLKKAAEQFADVLDSMVNCFKTGYGFTRAIQVISESYDDPWGTEFGKMSAELNLGATQEDILSGLSHRIPSVDVDLFCTALLIQKETGGNMVEMLSNLSKTIRERYKLFRKVKAISAQGKLSAGIVICVPFGLMAMMYLFLPNEVMQFVTHPIGIVIMVAVGIWMCIGIAVLYKIVSIEV
jgi:tight adherence protein B